MENVSQYDRRPADSQEGLRGVHSALADPSTSRRPEQHGGRLLQSGAQSCKKGCGSPCLGTGIKGTRMLVGQRGRTVWQIYSLCLQPRVTRRLHVGGGGGDEATEAAE